MTHASRAMLALGVRLHYPTHATGRGTAPPTLAERFRVVSTHPHIIEPHGLWTARMSVRKSGHRVPHVKWDEAAQEDAW